MFELDRAWRLHPQVALRAEPFGALAYHYGNRRLTFLRSAAMAATVRRLADFPSARAALAGCGVPAAQLDAYAGALARLADAEVIVDG